MSENRTNKFAGPSDDPSGKTSTPDQPDTPPPALAQFYADPRAKASAYSRTLRKAGVKAFRTEDVDEAHRQLGRTDPTLSRTLALASTGASLDVIGQWISRVVIARLHELVPDAVSKLAPSATGTLSAIVAGLRPDLRGKEKQARARAENLLRLCLIWLTRRRDLDPVEALQVFAEESSSAAEKKGQKSLRTSAQTLLVRAKPAQRRDLVVVATLYRDALALAAAELQEVQRVQAQLRERVSALESQLDEQNEQMRQAQHRRAEAETNLAAAKDDLRQQKELRVLDAEDAKGRLRQLLSGRIDPLLADAREALEFNPPRVNAAKQGIDLARSKIGEEAKEGDA